MIRHTHTHAHTHAGTSPPSWASNSTPKPQPKLFREKTGSRGIQSESSVFVIIGQKKKDDRWEPPPRELDIFEFEFSGASTQKAYMHSVPPNPFIFLDHQRWKPFN